MRRDMFGGYHATTTDDDIGEAFMANEVEADECFADIVEDAPVRQPELPMLPARTRKRLIDPTRITARSVLEARLGRKLGPISVMPRDIRKALYLLALQINKQTQR